MARRRRGAAFFVLVGALSAGGAAMAHVWVRMQVVELGYELARETHAEAEVVHQNQRLRLEVDALQSPARLAELARRDLRMEAPDPLHIRALGPRPRAVGRPARGRR